MTLVLETGRTVAGRYRLDHLLGQGGMGEVWAATHTVTRRSMAMKFVRGASHARPELRRRFMREARAASTVQHPNVVEVFDVFELDAETPVMVMELLSGETLGRKLAREGQLGLEETLAIVLPTVSAVGTAHALGVVHRDLKPENLFLAVFPDNEKIVKVLDFGIAKLSAGMAGETGVTETGTTLGTPCYMAPEQAMAERELDHRVDVWAIGVILYETLSGARPIDGDTIGQVVKNLMTTGITPLERVVPGLPEPLTALVNRMLSRERNRRPDDLREVFGVLRELTATKARSFGAPESKAGAGDEIDATVISRDAPRLDSSSSRLDQPPQRVDTAGPHAVSSRLKRRPQGGWLFAGAAASALAGGFLVYALTRPASESLTPPVEGSAAAPSPDLASASAPPLPTATVTSEPRLAPSAAASAVETAPSASAAQRAPAPRGRDARGREAKPMSSVATGPQPPSTQTSAAPAVAAPAPSPAPARRPTMGGLADKPPF